MGSFYQGSFTHLKHGREGWVKYLSDETRLFQSSKWPKYKNPKIIFHLEKVRNVNSSAGKKKHLKGFVRESPEIFIMLISVVKPKLCLWAIEPFLCILLV